MKLTTLFTFSIIIFFILPGSLCAQDTLGVEAPHNKHVQANLGVGYFRNDHSSLNRSLEKLGFNPIAEDLITVSASSHFFINRFLVGVDVMGFKAPDDDQPNNTLTDLMGYAYELKTGYAFVNKNKFRLYPYVGVQFNNSWLRLYDNSPVENMGDIFASDRKEGTIVFQNTSLGLGFHAEKLISLKNREWDCPQNARYMSVGVQLGYQVILGGSGNGAYNGQELSDAPDFGLSGPYVKLVLGHGSKIRSLKWK